MKSYTKEEIIEICEKASKDMKSFYAQSFVNYRGKSTEGILYTEIIAEWLLQHMEKFLEIQSIERKKGYKTPNHDGIINRETNRKEEITAKNLFKTKKIFEGFGRIIDYQTPLKNKQDDKGLGKIDLLSKNEETKCVYILELKKEDSKETMLRCILEAFTYSRIVSQKRLFKSFEIEDNYKLKASPLVYMNGVQYNEFKDKSRVFLHELMSKLESTPFFIEENVTFQINKQ
ncbi:MAG: hypothetical protein K6F78_04025 [Bacteroidaceae bacterium]|nr:hypothetical protein [Bacteroidaceae bacterium]